MSEQQYHWEALRKQRVIDRKYAVMNKSAAEQRQEDEANAHDAARAKLQSEQAMHERRRQLAEQVKQRDREGIQHSYSERERNIQRLLSERNWHDEMIAKMDQEEKDQLLKDLLRDHAQKSKVLRNHGLYRGDAKFFTDPQYN
ncbi:uncharacterized protein [Diadema setosum]|uniref:uncharacterized protein n=1 Tax=Diadema setosum TaxID=31175 RepID=UPI003B3BA2E7